MMNAVATAFCTQSGAKGRKSARALGKCGRRYASAHPAGVGALVGKICPIFRPIGAFFCKFIVIAYAGRLSDCALPPSAGGRLDGTLEATACKG